VGYCSLAWRRSGWPDLCGQDSEDTVRYLPGSFKWMARALFDECQPDMYPVAGAAGGLVRQAWMMSFSL